MAFNFDMIRSRRVVTEFSGDIRKEYKAAHSKHKITINRRLVSGDYKSLIIHIFLVILFYALIYAKAIHPGGWLLADWIVASKVRQERAHRLRQKKNNNFFNSRSIGFTTNYIILVNEKDSQTYLFRGGVRR